MEHPRIEHLYFVSIWGEIGWWQLIFSGEIEKKIDKGFSHGSAKFTEIQYMSNFHRCNHLILNDNGDYLGNLSHKNQGIATGNKLFTDFGNVFGGKKFRKYRCRNDFRMIVSNYLSLCTIKFSNSIWTILFSWGQPEFCSHSLKF